MASSIFKETTLTPFIFEKKYLCEDMRNFEKLLNALEDLAESGFVVGVYNSWLEIVSQAIMAYGDEIQYEMEVAMKHLADRQRIVCLNDKICSPENEVIWIEKANSLNNIREFDIILATFEALNTKTLDTTHRNQFREAFQNRGAQVLPQTKENMKKLITPILSYAEIIKIYDPYFDITKSRYTDAL